jgi:hypothetical protein
MIVASAIAALGIVVLALVFSGNDGCQDELQECRPDH